MLLFLIGIAAGLISGMGIGGGTILIPAIVIFFGIRQHVAQGINLVFFIPTAVIALIIHIKNKKVDFGTALPMVFSGIAGGCLGSILAASLEAGTMKKCFAVFLLLMAVYELLRKSKKPLFQ